MSKKSFKDINPATAFISSAQPPPPLGANYTDNTHDTDNTHKTGNTDNTDNTHDTHIVRSEDPPYFGAGETETKSKRLNVLIRPRLLQDFSKVAHMKRTSVNSLLNIIVADYVKKEAESIRHYNQTFKGWSG